jgi:hypothetical protein
LVELLVKVGQFTQKVGIAQAVATVGEGEVGSEAVVDEQVFESRQDSHALHGCTTALGIEMVGGELIGAEDVKPTPLAVDGAAGFVGMGDGAFNESALDGTEGFFGFLTAPGHDVGEGAFAERSTEEVVEKLAQAGIGKELVVTQVDRCSLKTGPILGRGGDFWRERGAHSFATTWARATSGPVLGDFELDGWELVDLSDFPVPVRRGCREIGMAVRAGGPGSEVVLLDVIRVGDFLESGAGMALLAAGLAGGFGA